MAALSSSQPNMANPENCVIYEHSAEQVNKIRREHKKRKRQEEIIDMQLELPGLKKSIKSKGIKLFKISLGDDFFQLTDDAMIEEAMSWSKAQRNCVLYPELKKRAKKRAKQQVARALEAQSLRVVA